MPSQPLIIFLGGLITVILGAEFVLRGASRIATLLGVRPILIGLTVVAVGTSAPELAVGVRAVLEGRGTLAVGNIAGTNMVNILLILGLSAALRPLPIHLNSVRLDVPVMIGAAALLWFTARDGVLSRLDGLVLIGAALVYLILLVRISRRESPAVRAEFADQFGPRGRDESGILPKARNAALLVSGIALTALGADLLVSGAVSMAHTLGVSDAIIGLTIIAIGTSAPELVTTVLSTLKNDRDVAVGNLIGSSITNILVILGITCVVAPHGVHVSDDVLAIDLPLALAVAFACLLAFRRDCLVTRRAGATFVALYAIYLGTLLFLRA